MVGNHPYSDLNEACVLGRASEKLWSLGKFQEATGRRVISVSVGFHFLARRVILPSPNLLEIKKSNFFRNSSQILPKSLPKQNQWRKLFGNFNNILLYIHLFGNLFLAKIMESKGAPPPPHPRNKAVLRDYVTNHHHPLGCWHWWTPLDFHGKKGVGPPKASWFQLPSGLSSCIKSTCLPWVAYTKVNFFYDAPIGKVKFQIRSSKVVAQGHMIFRFQPIIHEPHLFLVVDDKGRPCKSQFGHLQRIGW